MTTAHSQNDEGRQHPDGSLRRHSPTRKQGIQPRQRQPAHGTRRAGRKGQAPPGRPRDGTPPEGRHPQRRHPGEHGDVKPGNTHQVRHTGGPEHIPVGAFNGTLVPHHQRRQHTGQVAVGNALVDRFAHRLTRPLHGVGPGGRKPDRRIIPNSGTHVARGLNALLPQPQLVVKPVRVAVAVRCLQANRHLPTLTGAQVLGLALQGQQPLVGVGGVFIGQAAAPAKPGVPAQQDLRRQGHRPPVLQSGLHHQTEPQRLIAALRHGAYHPRDQQVLPLQRGVQASFDKFMGTPLRQAETQRCGQQHRQPARPGRASHPNKQQRQSSRTQQHCMRPSRPQGRLLQLHRSTRRKTAQVPGGIPLAWSACSPPQAAQICVLTMAKPFCKRPPC